MDTFSIDLYSLYKAYDGDFDKDELILIKEDSYGGDYDTDFYYDLYEKAPGTGQLIQLLCCDGEVCVIESVGDNVVTLCSTDHDNAATFQLSKDDFNIVCCSFD